MKKITILLLALLTAAPMFAQIDDGEEETIPVKRKWNGFYMGPKLGLTLSSMTQPNSNDGDLYDAMGIGYSAGVAMKLRLGKATRNSAGGTGLFGIGWELKYKNNSVKTLGTDEKGKEKASLSVSYFEVPIYVHVYPCAKMSSMNSFYIEAGVSFGAALSRSPESLSVPNPTPDYSSVTYYLDTEGSKLKPMDIHPLVGLGYTIPNTGLDINARYNIGTSKLAGNMPCKMGSLEISLSWMFSVCKF